jgi:hypothetical protein
MSFKVNLRNRAEWDRRGLAPHHVLTAWPLRRCNTGTDDAGAEYGEWFYVPDAPLSGGRRVIYYGYFGSGLPSEDAPWIFAEVFDGSDPDELADFSVRVREWESKPESDDQP